MARVRGTVPRQRHRSVTATILLLGAAIAAAAPYRVRAETLESALAKAYETNPQLNAQRAIVRQTDESVPTALSGYRPTVSANASVGREYSNVQQTIPAGAFPGFAGATITAKGLTTPYSAGLTGSETLFNGERTANGVRKAESEVSAARETLRMMEESVLLAAATVYMDMSRDTANLEVQQNNIRVLERTLTDTRNRFQAGQVTSTDVAQAEAQLAAGQANLHAAESTLMTTRANYRRVIGVEPSILAPASPVDRLAPSTLNGAIVAGIADNPSVTAALYGVDVAQLQVKIAEGALWPSLTGQYSIQEQKYPQILTPSLLTNSAMLDLSVPLYQGGAEYSAIRLDKEALDEKRLDVRPSARPGPRECGAGVGAIAGGKGGGRGRAARKRRGRARPDRRAQRSVGRPAHHAGRAQCRAGSGQCAPATDRRAARSCRRLVQPVVGGRPAVCRTAWPAGADL